MRTAESDGGLRGPVALVAAALVCALYLTGLSAMGLVGPDEPRYASIGREMALSGDWITPQLWGSPWFEKPALLYWMAATGFRAGFGPELAPRLPVALLSLAFLGFFWFRVRRVWGGEVAAGASAILATSAGWLAYSHIAVTDVPLSVLFSAAVLFSVDWIGGGAATELTAAAACLGLATLAKGLVPIVLFVPVLVMPAVLSSWRRLSDWPRPGPLIAFAVTALPWYVLCTVRNGSEFLRVFFVEQQFNRIGSAALQHVQPFWFYVPAALVLLFPWFPLLALGAPVRHDRRLATLAAVVAFGFVFFSISINKLPSYLLPLLPVASILMACGVARAGRAKLALVVCCALVPAVPLLPQVVADSLAHGLRRAAIPWLALGGAVVAGTVIGWTLSGRFTPQRLLVYLALAASSAFLWFEVKGFPVIDRAASSRTAWTGNRVECVAPTPRSFAYGLYYYSGGRLPDCGIRPPGIGPTQ